MNFPLFFEIQGHRYYLHIIFEVLAFFIGVRYYYFLKRNYKDNISNINRLWIMLGAMIGALIGSRLIAAFEIKDFLQSVSFLEFYNNKTVLGGFLGGLFGVEGIKKLIGEKESSGDLYVLPIILALFIGRIGCFSMGIAEPTFGVETDFFLGINLGDGKLRHPIMLYEMGFLAVLFVFFKKLLQKEFRNYKNGDAFIIFMLFYFTFRFLMEFLKPRYEIFLGLTIIQWCGIFIYIYYWKFFRRICNK
ncbi:prolipoprotein diacylglyceryl transferase family protein [Cloacibacterium sp.]|uniref:prolipoprotein diacylglyceryl transferase family protein n=1 Tax=Cloacibacterium sp. TaxID=1913682 RepID=UPI0039E48291